MASISVTPIVPAASQALAGRIALASAAEVKAATNSTKALTPTTLVNAPSVVKAWVNFNGTGTVAIRDSYNVSSITDNGVGDYTVNFTTALANANYAVSGSANLNALASSYNVILTAPYAQVPTASAVRVSCGGASTVYDCAYVSVSIHGQI